MQWEAYWTQGMDVSFWQDLWDSPKRKFVLKYVNFKLAAQQGMKFVILKSTTGTGGKDPTYDRHLEDAREAGLVIGAYHWYLPSCNPIYQAEWAITGSRNPDLPLFFDLEERKDAGVRKGKMWPDLRTCLLEVEARTGRRPIIYTNWDYWTTYYPDAIESEYFKLWVANYNTGAPLVPPPWNPRGYTFWQYSKNGNGKKYGCWSLSLDMDLFAGSLEELKLL